MNGRLTVGSLFSGIGGIELGFERVGGFETKWFIERDAYCQFILKKHWPEAIVYDDVAKIDFGAVPKVDILTGGFPCQDISNAGKRVGITGSRSSLWKYFCEAIRCIRPRYAFIENVSALTQRGLNVVLADLAKIGYDAEWYNISASAVGAPHRRERIFILAYPHSGRHIHGQAQEFATEGGKHALGQSIPSSSDVAHTNSSSAKHKVSTGGDLSSSQGIWAVEPDVGRVVNGLPFRVDRIKCLGNAVVPQCAEVFARAIQERERRLL